MALRVSRTARRRYGLDDLLPTGGRLPPPELPVLRRIADHVNRARALDEAAPRLSGATLLAASVIEDRLVGELARGDRRGRPLDWKALLDQAVRRLGAGAVEAALARWAAEFAEPEHAGGPAEQLRELVTLWLLADNEAVHGIVDLLSEGAPRPEELWRAGGPAVRRWVRRLRRLVAPAPRTPAGLEEQLLALTPPPHGGAVDRAGSATGEETPGGVAALTAADALAEERRPTFAPPGDGAPAAPPVTWEPAWSLAARYRPEAPWMAEVVIVAKQVHVWLDQLSRECGRTLGRLDEVPDRELDRLARWGFNAVWLVGLWQRSRASRWIKQLGGNPEAAASAYAVADYRVAEELGGEPALAALRDRAAERGLRLAADMVPNHMGVDSPWVLEHPERFLSLDAPPFPNYTFRGPDLSPDPTVSVYLEDHYYDRSDAAVVFERGDRRTGEVRYLYHGNDGTGLPWNDTAQLDYLRSDVRAAVSDTIVAVARRFPILRFDAAMTLARRHYQRLWFPLPGSGGAIPSRAGHGVDAEEFDRRFPDEFWREVVERLAEEVPDALLIAEAFWLMEAYFTRELGLHRVYNSAFVNHLRASKPGNLRRHLAEALLLDPRLLAHQVNYLSNPDEPPAIELFGGGERYFGACTLLATLPGLPMFAHGQVEGLRERYGMEYRRAYVDEASAPALVAAHERRITPLLQRRRIFAGVDWFRLYELQGSRGAAEGVLAFSNGAGGELHLVVSNQAAHPARGRLDRSTPYRPAEGRAPRIGRLSELLPPAPRGAAMLVAEDLTTGERLTWRVPLRLGLAVELAPWQTRVLTGFAWERSPRELDRPPRRRWWRRVLDCLRRLWRRLRGRP